MRRIRAGSGTCQSTVCGYPRPTSSVLLLQVTRERVRQVETKALLKLRQPMRSEALIEYTRANTQQLTWGQSGALGKKSS